MNWQRVPGEKEGGEEGEVELVYLLAHAIVLVLLSHLCSLSCSRCRSLFHISNCKFPFLQFRFPTNCLLFEEGFDSCFLLPVFL